MKLPAPHPNELIYSTVARAGVYFGLVSPKQLLDEVFADRKVIATLDLPSHLQSIVGLLSGTGLYDLETLVYKHTLFPLYAPFVPEHLRQRAIKRMADRADGAVHLMLGVAASRIKSVRTFRFCPLCMERQLHTYGEYYWQRGWFLPELPVCPEHGCLIDTSIHLDEHRHQFVPLNPAYFTTKTSSKYVANDLPLALAAAELLEQPVQQTPTFAQWTHFYHEIATECGCARGKQVDHEKILNLVCSRFGIRYLENKGLLQQSQGNSFWLRSIFRKHRKSFSFFEHLIVWQALVPALSVSEIFIKVRRYAPETVLKESQSGVDNAISISDECRMYRQRWEELVLLHGVKPARHQETGGSLYAWLYRHDRDWLLAFNEQQKRPLKTVNNRVDWHLRDRQLVRCLIKIHFLSENHPVHQRMSATWLLNQLPHKNSVAKKLHKLPLTQLFLVRYAESVTEYQLRRIAQFIVESREKHIEIKRWSLFRKVGLSDQRITPDTMRILDSLTYL